MAHVTTFCRKDSHGRGVGGIRLRSLSLGVVALAFSGGALAATPDRLDQLKREFPVHIAGPITARSDPAVQACWRKYHAAVTALTRANLAAELHQLQETAAREVKTIERRIQDRRGVLNSAGRHAERQNAIWLRQKLIPYLKRLVQLQRGR